MKFLNLSINPDDAIVNNFNAGLLYFKYTPLFENKDVQLQSHLFWNIPGERNNYRCIKKEEFLKKFENTQGTSTVLKARIKEMKNFVGSYGGYVVMENVSRFVCGIGYKGTLEWGFLFDWTTGMPFLPGSSFKGALLSYLEILEEQNRPVQEWPDKSHDVETDAGGNWSKEEIFHLFGPQGDKNHPVNKAHVGSVIFLNVFPEDFKGFEIDIITPHYKPYYTDNKPPADIYNPVPIPFLTIKPGARFVFMFRFRKKVNPSMIDKVKVLIQETGQNHGFGAKTATGYGYFRPI